jgi:hypothetical protein
MHAAVALLALAGAGERASGATGSGEVVVEVYSGFPASAPALAPAPAHFVIDVSGMLAGGESPSESEQRQFAQKLIVPYLGRHPGLGLESAAVHLFRRGQKQECPDAAGGASLAAGEALAQLDSELAKDASARNARVVLFSAFEGECAPRLCEVAARLVERGVWLELAAIQSDAAVPSCLATLRPPAQAPIPWLGGFAPASAPAFSVEAVTADGAVVLAQGTAGTPLRVEAGLRRISVALDPPEVIGPIQVRADQRLRIRVLDFPLSAPGERSWRVEVSDAK